MIRETENSLSLFSFKGEKVRANIPNTDCTADIYLSGNKTFGITNIVGDTEIIPLFSEKYPIDGDCTEKILRDLKAKLKLNLWNRIIENEKRM